MSELTFVSRDRLKNHATLRRVVWSKWLVDQLRNCAAVRRILWSKWLRLSEFHCTLSLQNWSMLILPSITVWADICFYSYRRSTKESYYCETYSVKQMIETWWVSLYTLTAQWKHVNSSMNELIFVSIHKRLTKGPRYGEVYVAND